MENFIGRDIGKYHIIEQLGEGGMAVVYKAFDTSLERFVAIKFIRKENIGESYHTQLYKRFEREAKVLASLDHPNIVTIFDYGQYQGSPFLVEKFISGGTLHPSRRPMPPAQAAALLAPVARALDYAHRHGVIHRDIKPGNILINEEGAPLLSDFGIAKILDTGTPHAGADSGLTATGMQIGTPEYMAPEQWQGKPVAQSDIYALGVVLYELVTGRVPYTADTPAAVMIKQVTEPLPRPRQFVSNLPEGLENMIFKALALKIENRYASMAEFAAALEQEAHSALVSGAFPGVIAQDQHSSTEKARLAVAERAALENKLHKQDERAQSEEEKRRIRTLQGTPASPSSRQPVAVPGQPENVLPHLSRRSRYFPNRIWVLATLIVIVLFLAVGGSLYYKNILDKNIGFTQTSIVNQWMAVSQTAGAEAIIHPVNMTEVPSIETPTLTSTVNLTLTPSTRAPVTISPTSFAPTITMTRYPATAVPPGTTQIMGQVLWNTTPVSGARIVIKENGNYYTLPALMETQSDAEGRYVLVDPPIGDYGLYVISPFNNFWAGYGLTITAGSTIVQDLYLLKDMEILLPALYSKVNTLTPTLEWKSFPEADYYHVDLFDNLGNALIRTDTTATSLKISDPSLLKWGIQYQWNVRAFVSSGMDIAKADSVFSTADAP